MRVEPDPQVSWSFDDESEFFAQYGAECRSAVYAVFGKFQAEGPKPAELSINYMAAEYGTAAQTTVAIKAPTRAEIEATFSHFEDALATATSTPPAKPPKPLPPVPRVFIGHGRATDWRDLKDHLHEQHQYAVEAYETGARTGHAIRDVLDKMLNQASFAVLVLTAEDEMADGQLRPRENVVHETGLFQGRLGWTRAIMLVEEGVEPFSNVAGIQQIRYSKGHIASTFGHVLATLRAEFGPGPFKH